MESRKKRLGPSKFGVRYENQRASWQSERLVVSYLSWHSGLSWNSGVLMKTSERLSFSIAHLSPLKQLRCKSGQKLPWLVDEKPPKRTNSPARSLVVPIKHGLRRILSSRDDHVSFLLDPDWFWEDPLCDTSKWQKSSFSYVFFRRDIYLNLFFFNQPIFSILTVQLRSEHLKANVFGMLFTWVIHCSRVCSWLTGYSFRSFIVISIRQKLFVSQIMHANAQPFNYIKSFLAKQKL